MMDPTRRPSKKNSARLYEASPLSPREVIDCEVSYLSGRDTSDGDVKEPFGGTFFIFMEKESIRKVPNDSRIVGSIKHTSSGWHSDIDAMVREEPNAWTECPYCGYDNGFNSVALYLLRSEGPPDRGAHEDIFFCHQCMHTIGGLFLWSKSRVPDHIKAYPNQLIKTLVEMFPYPVRSESGEVFGMPFHKGLYKNPAWYHEEGDYYHNLGSVLVEEIRKFACGEYLRDCDNDLTKYAYLPMKRGFLVLPNKHLHPLIKLRLMGVGWHRKAINLGLGRHTLSVRRMGYTVDNHYALHAKPTSRHKKFINVRPTEHPAAFQRMDRIDF